MTVVDVIVESILGRRVVVVDYAGANPGKRVVQPQIVYRAGDGQILVDVVQVGGVTSAHDDLPGWRTLRLDQIRDATPTGRRFGCAPELNLDATKYADVIVHCGES